jgi:small neutral amino acid transporter SnatA (MarC family)
VILGLVPVAAAAAARRTDPGRREMAWRLEAVATAVLAITWFVGQVAALPD